MQTFITSLTLVATLLHLTVGCCGHVRGDATHTYCQDAGVEECDHDHSANHATESESTMMTHAGVRVADHGDDTECPGHECQGCSCSVIQEDRPLASHGLDLLSVAWFTPTITLIQSAVSVAWEAADPPVRAAIAPPLSERSLI